MSTFSTFSKDFNVFYFMTASLNSPCCLFPFLRKFYLFPVLFHLSSPSYVTFFFISFPSNLCYSISSLYQFANLCRLLYFTYINLTAFLLSSLFPCLQNAGLFCLLYFLCFKSPPSVTFLFISLYCLLPSLFLFHQHSRFCPCLSLP